MGTERPLYDLAVQASIPQLVDDGWATAVFVRGSTHRVLFYRDGSVRFEHRCHSGGGVFICAPLLRGGHEVVSMEPLTITPAIVCTVCHTHGSVTKGRWS